MPANLDLSSVPDHAHAALARLGEDFAAACQAHELAPVELPAATARIWYLSDFVARTAIRKPQLFSDLLASGDLDRPYIDGEMTTRIHEAIRQCPNDVELSQSLRYWRHREMIRIAWRDLINPHPAEPTKNPKPAYAALSETLTDTTTLAEALIDSALEWLQKDLIGKHGHPRSHEGQVQQLLVLGMGKLGGRELNFSSDIDLIFTYPYSGQTDGERCLDNQQFFTRLGQRLIKALDEKTADGFVFRVDMRLRPFGDAGPLVMSFDAFEDYYETHGREWERYAMIKARAVAGDRAPAETLHAMLQPFVYRRYLDYGAFASLRDMKALINREAVRKGKEQDVKLGEIDILPDFAVQQLLEAYRFLRLTENRLQMWADQQTHALPSDPEGQARLACAMGFDSWSDFSHVLEKHMRHVHEQFQQVFAAPQRDIDAEETEQPEAQRDLTALWAGKLDAEKAKTVLKQLGVNETEEALNRINDLRESSTCRSLTATGRERLDKLMPLLLGVLNGLEHTDDTLMRLLKLVQTIARRSVYLSLLVENPLALSQLARLCDASPFIAEHLTRYPLLLDELLDPRSLYAPPDKQGLMEALREELIQVPRDDTEQIMDRLRLFKQVQVLKVAAADIMDVLPVMKVSDHLTWIAEVVLEQVLKVVMQQLIEKHGKPQCTVNGKTKTPGFAIVGYGKLGGLELGYGSDLDIVFLHDSEGENAVTDGEERPLENGDFFARLGQKILHFLGTFTPAGRLYEVDTRLRPSGASGLLVSSVKAFEEYQHHSAWTWEHQALVRARPVAGDLSIAEQFQGLRRGVLTKDREQPTLKTEVREMREKMWQELASRDPEWFDLKKDPGGIADIEFMVQYLVLAHSGQYPELCTYPDNIRILESLIDTGLLPKEDAVFLMDTYRMFRDRIHELSLQEQSARIPAGQWLEARERVQALWQQLMM
ncbi:bifunctional [glutamate--ammonia ligase]-adenylyl-L-tyrosine phosphorylase/[glutamate--ammonia-ligase] adenylyltransferase [Ectothiorhodosinus mongolicus]|nr:bifunctional [glutamate--ammonia ligase]-adenylyl-L-tyrosine phosphorylase/[glutamate--ammonia-ligase] adenylyltransferase [Ectothiorhodosinus mongolicus]